MASHGETRGTSSEMQRVARVGFERVRHAPCRAFEYRRDTFTHKTRCFLGANDVKRTTATWQWSYVNIRKLFFRGGVDRRQRSISSAFAEAPSSASALKVNRSLVAEDVPDRGQVESSGTREGTTATHSKLEARGCTRRKTPGFSLPT